MWYVPFLLALLAISADSLAVREKPIAASAENANLSMQTQELLRVSGKPKEPTSSITLVNNTDVHCSCPPQQANEFSKDYLETRTSKFKDVMFVVVFNSPYWDVMGHVDVMPFLTDLYKPYTSRLFFCSKHERPHKLPPGVDFIQVEDMGGVMDGDNVQYECLRKALLYKSVSSDKGFVVVADDALINFRRLAEIDLQKMGMYASDPIKQVFSLKRPLEDALPAHLWHMMRPNGYQAAKATFDELIKIDADGHGASWAKPYLKAMNKFDDNFRWNRCDFFYLPASLTTDYFKLSTVFAHNKVYFELAIPTMFSLLSEVKGIEIADVPGLAVDDYNINGTLKSKDLGPWNGVRDAYWENQDAFATFGAVWWHPVKLSYVVSDPKKRLAFCKTTVQCRKLY